MFVSVPTLVLRFLTTNATWMSW